jgi:hypothetical protein
VPDDPEIPGAPGGEHPALALAERDGRGCALARAVRASAAAWALVLDSSGVREAFSALRRCGFHVRSGTANGPALLQD